jgi:CheY-like chemotaxis protein
VTLATVDAPTPAGNGQEARLCPGRSLRLLVVDDHEPTLTVLTRLLSRDGHHVVGASTMRAGLDAVAAETFDVVVSDLGLPDGSGLDLMREIRLTAPIAGIALSGYGMEEDITEAKKAGFYAHLVKPVDLNRLRQLLTLAPERTPPER